MDVNMPVMDGFEATSKIRESIESANNSMPRFQDTKLRVVIIGVTAYSTE